MVKASSQDTEASQPSQQYDTTLKDWLRQEVGRVLPILLPGAVYEVTLAQQIIWMELLLERTDTVSSSQKRGIQEELKVYDPLWEENSKVRRIRAESEAEGLAKGKAEGRVEGLAEGEAKGLQRALVSAIRVHFPELAELAQQKVVKINDTSSLDLLLKQVITAPDERTARWLLDSVAA
jgi:hypothetical protein